tara:strand:+ start:5861 stop:6286 length:426 start_codon:yes stop_codon:yes gene_type:complete
MTYLEYLQGLQLEFFTPAEIAFRGASDSGLGLNTDPPAELWANMVKTAWLADQARGYLGSPIRVLSAYRSPAYNSAISGASQSRHLSNDALDLQPLSTTPRKLHAALVGFRDAGLFRGGLGLYSSFVHVDRRGGANADWTG